MRRGVRIGIDIGSVRVGVAASDPDGLVASPVETVTRDTRGDSDLARIALIAAERDAAEVVVGLPLSMSGAEGPAAASARAYAADLALRLDPVGVRLVDERLSTVTAQRGLRHTGVRGRAGRAVIDQAAAVIILQSALDIERSTGNPPGEVVPPGQGPAGTRSDRPDGT